MKMRVQLVFLTVVLAAMIAPLEVSGQDRVIVIETNHGDANVFVDDVWLGRAGERTFSVSVDAETLSVSPPGLDAWSIDPIRVNLATTPEDTLTIDAHFPYHYKVETVPVDVDVFHVDSGSRSLLGEAPLLYVTDTALQGTLSLEKEGYHSKVIDPEDRIWNRYLIELQPRTDMAAAGPDVSLDRSGAKRRRWIDVAAVGTAMIAGALAVHYRTKADNRFDEWEETGSPELKDEIRRLDTYSGVAIGTMQVGLGVFAIRLAF